VNNLRDRLDRFADAGTEGVRLSRPDEAPPGNRRSWRGLPALAAAAIVVVLAVGLAVVLTRDDDTVRTEQPGDEQPGDERPGEAPDGGAAGDTAVVAVTYGDPSVLTDPAALTLRFLDGDGDVIAERSWSEVEQPGGAGGQVVAMGGLVQHVPAGDVALEATLDGPEGPVSCTQDFTASSGDRLVVRAQVGMDFGPGADGVCAAVMPVDEWVGGRTSPTGADYVGLTLEEAEARAAESGLTTRVVGADGADLVVTMDFRPDRLNLALFDGTVVAASLEGEETGAGA
jgi:hypothetical protein